MKLLWIGPVSTHHLAGVPLPEGVELQTVNRGAEGEISSTAFRRWAAQGLDRIVPGDEQVDLAGFSAGGAAIDTLLQLGGRERVRHIVSADGYYNIIALGRQMKPGYLRRARELIDGDADGSLVFTAGATAGPGHLSCRASLEPLVQELRLVPRPAREAAGIVRGTSPGVARRGRVTVIDYGAELTHGEHATRAAPAALRAIYAGGARPSAGGPIPWLRLAVLGLWLAEET